MAPGVQPHPRHVNRSRVVAAPTVVIALYKGQDAPDTRATSYRLICVTARIQAVVDRIIVNRLTDFAAETGILQDEQYGFQPVRSCEHAVAILMMAVESRAMSGTTVAARTTYAAFLDVKSAFDSVSRERLTVPLYDCGIRGARRRARVPPRQWAHELQPRRAHGRRIPH